MAESRLVGPLGRHPESLRTTPGSLGRNDGASPGANARLATDSPGSLGRRDWAAPGNPAFASAAPLLPVSSIVFGDQEAGPIRGYVPERPPSPPLRVEVPVGVKASPGDPPWLIVARKEEQKGIHELSGLDHNNPRILEYLMSVPGLAAIPYKVRDQSGHMSPSGKMMSEVDETAWCGCFVNWCLKTAGMRGGSASAQAWLKYGSELPLDQPRVGAVAIIYHTPTAETRSMTRSGYHVAFYVGGPADGPILLGGNQGNSVSHKQFSAKKVQVKGYRWPVEPRPKR